MKKQKEDTIKKVRYHYFCPLCGQEFIHDVDKIEFCCVEMVKHIYRDECDTIEGCKEYKEYDDYRTIGLMLSDCTYFTPYKKKIVL